MKIRIAAVSAAAFVALLGAGGPAAAATSTSYGTTAQHAAVTQLAGADDDPTTPGGGNNPAPLGNQQPAANQQQAPTPTQLDTVQTQSGGGAIAVGSVAILLLGTVAYFLVKRGGLKAAHLALGVAMGVLLAGTFIGPLVQQITGSAVTSFGTILGGL